MSSRRVAEAALALLLTASAAAAQPRTAFDFAAVMECRARAIAQLQLADFETAAFGEAETRAIREMSDTAIRLGVWGRSPGSVGRAIEDMQLGERFLIENARRVSRFARDWDAAGPFDAELSTCVATLWTALRAVMDDVLLGAVPETDAAPD